MPSKKPTLRPVVSYPRDTVLDKHQLAAALGATWLLEDAVKGDHNPPKRPDSGQKPVQSSPKSYLVVGRKNRGVIVATL